MAVLTRYTTKYLKSPYIILILAGALFCYDMNWYLLFAVPLIGLGWLCCAPNLNLAQGLLSNLVAVVLLALSIFLGTRIFFELAAIAWLAWLGCSLELAWRIETKRKGYLGEEQV